MSNWSLIIHTALFSGVALSIVLTTIMIISAAIAPDMWISKYPPAIQEKYGPMSPRAARFRPYVAVVFFAVFLITPLLGLFVLRSRASDIAFLPALVFSAVTLLVFNTYDLLILDWILFCTIQPRQIVLPGTEGMPGYRDYRFHFIGFLKGLVFCAVGGLVVAGIWMVVSLF